MSIIRRWRIRRLEHEELDRRTASAPAEDRAAIANPDDRPPAHRPRSVRRPPLTPSKPKSPPEPSFAELRVAVSGLGQGELDRLGVVCTATIDWCVEAGTKLRQARSQLRADAKATQPRKKMNGRRTSSRRDRSGT